MNAAPDAVTLLVDDTPPFHAGGTRTWNALPGTLDLLARLVFPGARTLETGAGASTVVFAAAGARHIAISPDEAEHERIREYCTTVGIDVGGLTFLATSSDQALPAIRTRTPLDVAFIDGRHSFPFPVIDFHFVDRLLRVGGILVLDDVPIPAVSVVYDYVRESPDWAVEALVDDRAAAVRKLADADPDDNWRRQPLNRRYPDFSYLGWRRRVVLSGAERLANLRSRAASRVKG